jgi:phosphoribosylformylglycinamidine synthase
MTQSNDKTARKAAVIVFPGSNCDQDCVRALRHTLHIQVDALWHDTTNLSEYDLIVLPGGFSYGDYLRSGAIAGTSPVMQAVRHVASAGGAVLGICYGFQILLESGLLPGAMRRNVSQKFQCAQTTLTVETTRTVFTNGYTRGERIRIPIAHGEGNYYCDEATLRQLEGNDQIAFRYAHTNPNGSVGNIAGITNEAGNVLGMMPHPERAVDALLGSEDGQRLFTSIVKAWEGQRRATTNA